MTQPQTETRSWDWAQGSRDDLHILESPDGLLLRGVHGQIHYTVFANGAYEAQWLRVLHVVGTETIKRIDLERQSGRWWHKDGDVIEGSEAAIDPDIACTAATNTLPIRRLRLNSGDIADIQALYIPVPDLTPRIVHQRYLRHRGGYTYENPETGFSARLTVDGGGWVRDYPGLCQMDERK